MEEGRGDRGWGGIFYDAKSLINRSIKSGVDWTVINSSNRGLIVLFKYYLVDILNYKEINRIYT